MLKAYYLLLSNIILKSLCMFENVILSLARKREIIDHVILHQDVREDR